MTLRHLGHRVRRGWPALKRVGPRCVLALVTGCRGAATPYSSESGTGSTRSTVLARQVMEDSAREITNRPLRSGWHFLSETSDHIGALAAGEFGKRVVLPLRGTPEALAPSAETLDPAAFEAEVQRLTGEELQPADVRIQVSGDDSL